MIDKTEKAVDELLDVAVEAKRGKCRLPKTRIDHGRIEYNGVTEWRKCSACCAEVLAYPAHFCPNCGRRVVDEC